MADSKMTYPDQYYKYEQDSDREFISKVLLCVLKTQMGKTFAAISKIYAEIIEDKELGRSINIICTMNTLLNNKQFAKRLQTIESNYGKGSICILSSKYSGPYTHVKSRLELQGLCSVEATCPRIVLACSNKARFIDVLDFLKVINKNKMNIDRANVYYDELHSYINDTLRSQIEEINSLDVVKSITALTASPDKIWNRDSWYKLKLIELEDCSELNYAGCNDMIFNCIDDFFATHYTRPGLFDFDEKDRQTLGFIENVLKKYPEILAYNTRSFIPAHIRRSGHNKVRDLIFTINSNSVVCVINGAEKTLQYKDVNGHTKTLLLTSEDEELCETIARLVTKHDLKNRPLVITGFLCVGMGQTLTHKTLGPFTSAIFSHLDLTNDDIYQLFGRITGRTKDWENYVQTQVYCPTVIMNRCSVMEECARNMVIDHNGEEVTHEDYIEPMSKLGDAGQDALDNIRIKKEKKPKKPKEYDIKSFNSESEARNYIIKWLKDKNDDKKHRGPNIKKLNSEGFYMETINKKKSVWSTKEIDDDKVYIGNANNEYWYYACYRDITDSTTLEFRVINPKV